MTELQLYIGRKNTGIMIWQDPRWIGAWGGSGMWRVIMPDGRISDMVNLTRAKDAAMSIVRSEGGRQGKALCWKHHHMASSRPTVH